MANVQAPIRPKIAFIDPYSAEGYDLADLQAGGLGGTEATVLRVSAALNPTFDISHYQNGRLKQFASPAGHLWPLAEVYSISHVDVFVVINRWKMALKLRKSNPEIPIFLWLHVYPGRHNRKMGRALKDAGVTVICVSQTHAQKFSEFLGSSDLPVVTAIYNPLSDDLHADDTPRDPNRLLFASSPHKGLSEVFEQFAALHRSVPKLSLAIADPGYLSWDTGPVPDGVIFLGSLSHPALIRQMRRSLCLFNSQTSFAETFGLVLAEANAVGTPVLVHQGLGANDEIVSDSDQKIDGHDPGQILSRIESWRHSFPRVSTNPDFRLASVAQHWTETLSNALKTQASPMEGAV